MSVCLKTDHFHLSVVVCFNGKAANNSFGLSFTFLFFVPVQSKDLGVFLNEKWLFIVICFSFVLCILAVVLRSRKDLGQENEARIPDEFMICLEHWLFLSASSCGAAEPDSFLSESKPGCGPACTCTNQHSRGIPRSRCAAPDSCSILPASSSIPPRSGIGYQSAGHCRGHEGQQSPTWIPNFGWKFPSCVRSLSNSEHPHSLGAFGNHISKN